MRDDIGVNDSPAPQRLEVPEVAGRMIETGLAVITANFLTKPQGTRMTVVYDWDHSTLDFRLEVVGQPDVSWEGRLEHSH